MRGVREFNPEHDLRPPIEPAPELPRKAPQQCRSRFMVDAIVDACEILLQNEGVSALTATRIADRAGVTRGSMYQYFPSVESVVTALYERKIRAHLANFLTEDIEAALHVPNRDAALVAIVEVMIGFHLDMLALNPDHYRKYIHHFDLAKWYNELRHQPRASLEFTRRLIGGTGEDEVPAFLISHQLMVLGKAAQERPDYLTNPHFVRCLLDMCRVPLRSDPEKGCARFGPPQLSSPDEQR